MQHGTTAELVSVRSIFKKLVHHMQSAYIMYIPLGTLVVLSGGSQGFVLHERVVNYCLGRGYCWMLRWWFDSYVVCGPYCIRVWAHMPCVFYCTIHPHVPVGDIVFSFHVRHCHDLCAQVRGCHGWFLRVDSTRVPSHGHPSLHIRHYGRICGRLGSFTSSGYVTCTWCTCSTCTRLHSCVPPMCRVGCLPMPFYTSLTPQADTYACVVRRASLPWLLQPMP